MRFVSGGLIPHPQINWDVNCFIHDGVHLTGSQLYDLTDAACATLIRDCSDATRGAVINLISSFPFHSCPRPIGYLAAVINDRFAELYSDHRHRPNASHSFHGISQAQAAFKM